MSPTDPAGPPADEPEQPGVPAPGPGGDTSPPDPADVEPTPVAKRQAPARDVAARLVREALDDGRLTLSKAGVRVLVAYLDGTPEPVLPQVAKTTRALSIHLRDLYAKALNSQPAPEALRVMREVVLAQAEHLGRSAQAAGVDAQSGTQCDSDVLVFDREEGGRESDAVALIALVDELHGEFWHTPSGDLYVSIEEDGRLEHRSLASKDFRRWLQARSFTKHKTAAKRDAVTDAMGVFEGRALTGAEHPIFVRVASHESAVYVDLADPERRIVRVRASGWELVPEAPVRFRRPSGMLPLPVPRRGGRLLDLRPLVNVPDDDGWVLFIAFLLGALHPRGPYAVLVLLGEAGSAKSTLAKVIVALLDPKDTPLRRPPREERDLAIAARHGRIIAFNNLSRIPDGLSDAICSIATDGGSVFRTLYSDEEETRFAERRPVVLNGIEDFIARGDLADRSLKLVLKRIEPTARRTEEAVLADLERLRPAILGALLDAVAGALANEPGLKLPEVPRLADLARWVVAAEPVLGWKPGTFLATYRRAIGASSVSLLEDSAVARCLTILVAREPWEGSATELLQALTLLATEDERRAKTWPRTARALAGEVRRLAPDMRRVGHSVEDTDKDPVTRRVILRITAPKAKGPGNDPSDPSDASKHAQGTPRGPSSEGSAEGSFGDDPSEDHLGGPAGAPSEASKDPKDGIPPLAGASCGVCGQSSPYDGWHFESCTDCGDRCPCDTCVGRRGVDHE